jgi:hypothetical protein
VSQTQKQFLTTMERLHGALLLVWLGLTPPTILFWSESIKYLVFISVYTIVATHAIGWITARAQKKGANEK